MEYVYIAHFDIPKIFSDRPTDRPTDRQTDIVVHREVTPPKIYFISVIYPKRTYFICLHFKAALLEIV